MSVATPKPVTVAGDKPAELKTPEDFVHQFNVTINNLLKELEDKCVSEVEKAHVDRARNRLSIAKNIAGKDVIIINAGKYIYGYKDKILARDENFALQFDLKGKFGKHVSKQDEFVWDLVSIIKTTWLKLGAEVKEKCTKMIMSLLEYYVKYRLAVTDAENQKNNYNIE